MQNVLIADDEADIRDVLKLQLEFQGFVVDVAVNGQDVIDSLNTGKHYDLIILDIMMPKVSGLEACLQIRKITNVPILFLTAKTGEKDIVSAYTNGGDDFLSKPFSKVELMAKIKALIRRYRIYSQSHSNKINTQVSLDGFVFDLKNRTATKDTTLIELTNVEADILFLLLEKRGSVFSSKQIFEAIWHEPYFASANNTVMVHIYNLRRKLEEERKESIIRTAWGKGYCIDETSKI